MSALRVCVAWAIVVVLVLVALVRRKKIRVLPSVLLTVCITFFSLLSPWGKVLFQAGTFRITQGALFVGLHKSAVLVGMVFLSQVIVSLPIAFPGAVGRCVSEIFFWFNQLTAQRISFKKGHLIEQIDEKLLALDSGQTT